MKNLLMNTIFYRITTITLQLAVVNAIMLEFSRNWTVVVMCNIICTLWYFIYHFVIKNLETYMAICSGDSCKNDKIRLYLSHPIRGSSVDKATKDCQYSNSERAILASRLIENEIPNLFLICPGDYEKFVYWTYALKLLTDEQILDVDCKILGDCDGLLAYDFDTSKGVEIEVKKAKDLSIPIFRFKEVNLKTLKQIKKFVRKIANSKAKK